MWGSSITLRRRRRRDGHLCSDDAHACPAVLRGEASGTLARIPRLPSSVGSARPRGGGDGPDDGQHGPRLADVTAEGVRQV